MKEEYLTITASFWRKQRLNKVSCDCFLMDYHPRVHNLSSNVSTMCPQMCPQSPLPCFTFAHLEAEGLPCSNHYSTSTTLDKWFNVYVEYLPIGHYWALDAIG
ncbi:unnamed protein product [Boreogadus saida]